jgi:uncharacterized phosphosugar-binding protein
MSFPEKYLDGAIALLRRIADEEMPRIQEAGKLLADAIANGQRIFAFGCSHSSLPIQDIVARAGGLALINPMFGPGIASLETRPTTIGTAVERLEGMARIILDNHPIESGDVLILVSVSGRNAVPVELAQLARERGIKIIGVTSRVYTEAFPSRHPSGKKMYEFADIVLDNKVEAGDAMLEAEGVPQKFCPASGITSIAVLQAVVAATVEELLAKGVAPPIFLAGNVVKEAQGLGDYNARMVEENKDRIFYM